MVRTVFLWATAAVVTPSLVKGSPYGAWRLGAPCMSDDNPQDLVIAVDDALTERFEVDQILRLPPGYLEDGEDWAGFFTFNKVVSGCSPDGALEDEVTTCASVASLVPGGQFRSNVAAEAERQRGRVVLQRSSDDGELVRADDAAFALMGLTATVFRPNSFRAVAVMSSVGPRFTATRPGDPDPNTNGSPCAYVGEKELVTYYTPYCGSSRYGSVQVFRQWLYLNQAFLFVYLNPAADPEAIARWDSAVETITENGEIPVVYRRDIDEIDLIIALGNDVQARRQAERCIYGDRADTGSGAPIALAAPPTTDSNSPPRFVLLMDDAITDKTTVDSIPASDFMQGFRFNKRLGNCLATPTADGHYERPDRSACGVKLVGEGEDDIPMFYPTARLQQSLNEGDVGGDQYDSSGIRARDLSNAVFASTFASEWESESYREKVVVIYTALKPEEHVVIPCGSETSVGGGIEGFNVRCTTQRKASLETAIREVTGKGSHILVVVPTDVETAEAWNSYLAAIVQPAFDARLRKQYVYYGELAAAIDLFRR